MLGHVSGVQHILIHFNGMWVSTVVCSFSGKLMAVLPDFAKKQKQTLLSQILMITVVVGALKNIPVVQSDSIIVALFTQMQVPLNSMGIP